MNPVNKYVNVIICNTLRINTINNINLLLTIINKELTVSQFICPYLSSGNNAKTIKTLCYAYRNNNKDNKRKKSDPGN